MQDLRARIRAADVAIQAKRNEQAALTQQIRSYQGRIQSSPQVEEQFKELTRDYQNSQALYQSLTTKMNESQMTTDLEKRQEGETFTVLDAPNPVSYTHLYANKKHMYILRGTKKIPFDYTKALKGDMQGVTLAPGDTIVAP